MQDADFLAKVKARLADAGRDDLIAPVLACLEQVESPGQVDGEALADAKVKKSDRAFVLSVLVEARTPDGALWPFPIAFAQRASVTESPTARFSNALVIHEQLMRITTLVLVVDLAPAAGRAPKGSFDPAAQLTITKTLRRLRSPHRGDWFASMLGAAKLHAQYRKGSALTKLARAASTLQKVTAVDVAGRAAGRPLHEALLSLRNNEMAHAGALLDSWMLERLPAAQAWGAQLMAHFADAFAGLRFVGRLSDGRVVQLHGLGLEGFPEWPGGAELRLERGEVAVVTAPGKALLRLAPVLEWLADADPLTCFDGYTKTYRTLIGVGTRTHRKDVEVIFRFLTAYAVDYQVTREELDSWSISEWAMDASRSTIDRLRGVKYFPESYVERRTRSGEVAQRGVDDVVQRFVEHGREPALLVIADAGAGKTSLFCRLAERLLVHEGEVTHDAGQRCVVMVLGESISERAGEGGGLYGALADALGIETRPRLGGVGSFAELLDVFRQSLERRDGQERRELYLLVDAVNESRDPAAVLAELQSMASAARVAWERAGGKPWVRIVASVRTSTLLQLDRATQNGLSPLGSGADFAMVEDDRGELRPYLSVRSFTEGEAERAYRALATDETQAKRSAIPWEALPPKWRTLLTHPLFVGIFHQAYAGANVLAPSEASENMLWEHWVNAVLRGPGLSDVPYEAALALASAALDAGGSRVPEAAVDAEKEEFKARFSGDAGRLATLRSPIEYLEELNVLRRDARDALDFRNDALAETLGTRVLQRRLGDGPPTEEALATLWGGPASRWLDGAVIGLLTRLALGEELSRGGARGERSTERRRRARPTERQQVDLFRWVARCPRVDEGRRAEVLHRFVLSLTPVGASGTQDKRMAWVERILVDAFVPKKPEDLAWSIVGWAAIGKAHDLVRHHIGGFDAARTLARVNMRVAEGLVSQNSNRVGYKRDLVVACLKLGELEIQTDPDAARQSLSRALSVSKLLVELEPDVIEYQRYMGVAYSLLADIELVMDPGSAHAMFEASLEIRRWLAALESRNVTHLRDLAILCNKIGDLELSVDPGRALAWFNEGLSVAQRSVEIAPESLACQSVLGASYERMGDVGSAGTVDLRMKMYDIALGIRKNVVAIEPDNARYILDLIVCYDKISHLLSSHDLERSMSMKEEADSLYCTFISIQPAAGGELPPELDAPESRDGARSLIRGMSGHWKSTTTGARVATVSTEDLVYGSGTSASPSDFGNGALTATDEKSEAAIPSGSALRSSTDVLTSSTTSDAPSSITIKCHDCGAKYVIKMSAIESICAVDGERIFKVRCKKCPGVMVVRSAIDESMNVRRASGGVALHEMNDVGASGTKARRVGLDSAGDDHAPIRKISRMVADDPNDVVARIKYAEALSALGRTDEAVAEFEAGAALLREQRRMSDYMKVVVRLLHHRYDRKLAHEMAEMYLDGSDARRALGILQEAYRQNPSDPATLEILVRAFQMLDRSEYAISICRLLAEIYLYTDRAVDRVRVLRKILEIDPFDVESKKALSL